MNLKQSVKPITYLKSDTAGIVRAGSACPNSTKGPYCG
jgi:hypothetical protein